MTTILNPRRTINTPTSKRFPLGTVSAALLAIAAGIATLTFNAKEQAPEINADRPAIVRKIVRGAPREEQRILLGEQKAFQLAAESLQRVDPADPASFASKALTEVDMLEFMARASYEGSSEKKARFVAQAIQALETIEFETAQRAKDSIQIVWDEYGADSDGREAETPFEYWHRLPPKYRAYYTKLYEALQKLKAKIAKARKTLGATPGVGAQKVDDIIGYLTPLVTQK